jgi:hypothetical protein
VGERKVVRMDYVSIDWRTYGVAALGVGVFLFDQAATSWSVSMGARKEHASRWMRMQAHRQASIRERKRRLENQKRRNLQRKHSLSHS